MYICTAVVSVYPVDRSCNQQQSLSLQEKLKQLADSRMEGLISEDEYSAKKLAILSNFAG